MRILAIDSSAVSASCAITEDGRLIAQSFVNIGMTHSQTLMPMVEDTIRQSGKTLEDMDLIAVCAGPGSFTGVRIGVATVKGLAFTSDKKCAGVSTLEAIAYTAQINNGIVCAVMDARCQQVYNALFRFENGECIRLCEDRAIAISELESELEKYGEPVMLAGDGAVICKNTMTYEGLYLAPENVRMQSGYGAAAAAMKLSEENYVSAAELQPIYLRVPQAERELKKRQ